VSNDRIGQCTKTHSVPDIDPSAAREDPRVTGLRAAVGRLSRELAAYPARLPDREVAEEELALLDADAAAGALSVPRLRESLLVVAGALGSVSALAAPLDQVHHAIDVFGMV
jgi:maleate cis-trans isomerase